MNTKYPNPTRSRHWFSVGRKLTLPLAACALLAGSLSASAADEVVAGWDTWVDTGGDVYNATVLNGATGVAVGTADTVGGTYPGWANWGGAATHNSGASIDGTWGTVTNNPPSVGTSATDAVGLLNRTPSGAMTFTITNTSGGTWSLSGFHFDGVRVRTTAPPNWSLSILAGSAVTLGAVTNGTILTDNSSPFLDRENVDIDLSGLTDRTVETGEIVIFELAWTGGSGANAGGNNTMIDNVAVTAGPPPFPTLTWVGDGSGNVWDALGIAANWTNITDAVGPVAFTNSNGVVFDDTSANTTVNLSGTVEPAQVTVTNSVNNYTLSGGTIGGAGALTKQGTGILTLSSVTPAYTGGTTIEGGTLAINSAASIALAGLSGSGALTKSGAGTLTLSGANSFSGTATVTAGGLTLNNDASGNAAYQINAGTLSVQEAAPGTLSMSSLVLASGTTLVLNDGASSSVVPLIQAPSFTNGGTVTVSYSVTTFAPGPVVLIDYDAATSQLGAFTLSALPAGVTGSIVTNVANSSIDLLITGVPVKTWSGTSGDLWDVLTTANWNGGAATYAEGDAVRFDDSGANTTINVNNFSSVNPSLVWVTNSSTAYSFTQGGINTPTLVKQGSGTLTLASSVANSFTNISLLAGTLSYEVAATETATIAGAGTLRVGGTFNTVTLSGNMSGFDGPISVTSGNTLTLGVNNVLGTSNGATTVASGATLEINGKTAVTEQVIVSGTGASSDGAIKNSAGTGTAVLGAFRQVRLAGDTSFGGTARWDIRAVDNSGTNNAILDTTGGSYNVTKSGANIVALVSVDISASVNNFTVDGGLLSFENYTPSLGNPSGTLFLNSGQITFFQSLTDFTPSYTKNLQVGFFGTILRKAGAGNVNFLGPVTVNGDLELQGAAGTLEISGAVSGLGGVNKTDAGTVALLGNNTYSGATTVSAGTLVLSTASSGSSGYTVNNGATLGVRRTTAGGTLTTSSLTLGETPGSGTVSLVFELGTAGGSANALLNVSGGTLTTNAATYNVSVQADLNTLGTGTFALLKYAPGAFTNAVAGTLAPGISGTITNNTAGSQVEVIVTSVSRSLAWRGNVNTDWNINTTANWLDATNATTYKQVGAVGDIVTFGDGASNYTVNLSTTVTPGGQYVAVTSTNVYTFTGSGGIAGPVGVRVTDTGTGLVLGGNNTYTGGTFFDNGIISVGSESNLGGPTGELRWSGGTMQANGSLTNTRPLAFQTTTAQNRINVATNQTVQLGGTITNSSVNTVFYKSGPGTLVLTNEGNLRLQVDEGTTVLAGNAKITNGTSFQNISGTNGVAKLVVKDNALLENTSTSALNIADGNNQTNSIIAGELYIQDNAVLSLRDLYVGKYLNATGRVYQTGGLVTNNNAGAGNWRLGGITDGVDTNTFGGYYLSGGTLALTRPLQVGRLGAGELVVSGSGLLTNGASGGNINLGEQATGSGSMTVNGGTVVLASDSFLRVPFNGVSGTLAISNGGSVTVGTLQMGATNTSTGSATVGPNGTLATARVFGQATSSLAFNNGTLRAIASSATFLEGLTNVTIGAGGLTVDTDGNAITVNQNISGSGALTKIGAGTLTLNSQSYTGNTVVDAGTLAGNTELAGTVLQGSLVVNSGGAVQPGGPGLGIIYASNGKSVTLGGAANLEIAKAGAFSFLSDKLQADGFIGQGGTLNVSINEPSHTTALAVGNEFTLFQAGGGLTGGFTTVSLPTVDPLNTNTITWNTSQLATLGKIWVASTTPPGSPVTISPPPTLVQSVVGGTNLVFNWGSSSNNYQGYTLQVQTNLLSVGLKTNWVSVPGTESITGYTQAVNRFNPTVFYRLVYTNAP